jgi:hypothetical protein
MKTLFSLLLITLAFQSFAQPPTSLQEMSPACVTISHWAPSYIEPVLESDLFYDLNMDLSPSLNMNVVKDGINATITITDDEGQRLTAQVTQDCESGSLILVEIR